MNNKQLTARVTAKGELSLPAALFQPHSPPGYFWVGCPCRPWHKEDPTGLRISLSHYQPYSSTSLGCRRTYLPAERSRSIRVSVKTEFKATHQDPEKFVDYEFPIRKTYTRYGTYGKLEHPIEYIQIDIRRRQHGKTNRSNRSQNRSSGVHARAKKLQRTTRPKAAALVQ